MDNHIVSVIVRPAGFRIRSYADAERFCKNIMQSDNTYEIPDADDQTLYHVLVKDKEGRVVMGSAHYGTDPLLAEIPCCDGRNLIRRVYQIRKSINLKYFKGKRG